MSTLSMREHSERYRENLTRARDARDGELPTLGAALRDAWRSGVRISVR